MTSESSRPLLIPQNRKLRHLQGVYLRNLTATRPRGHSIDDASLNKSPSKLEQLREPQLHHAQSSDALAKKVRPGKQRRRSTIWAGQSPGYRQKKLEDVIGSGMIDSFFSLHVDDMEDPIYISEVVEKAMLQNRTLPSNCVIFHLIDGIYAFDMPEKPLPPRPMAPLPTSSYRALMRLSSLDDSIQDALAMRELLASQITTILQDLKPDESPQAEEKSALAGRYLSSERKLLKQATKTRSELTASLAARREAIKLGFEAQSRAEGDVDSARGKLASCRELLQKTKTDILGQRRRVCEELLSVFPIEPTTTPLIFTICSLPLPNSSFDDDAIAGEDTVAAALGLVALLVDLLQYYLSVPLPYPLKPYGSRSIIRDEISILADGQRLFPLFTKGVVRYRFDYGVFLLNKDIDWLAESQGLKVIDIRHTLPNLKYLLYVCSAGTSELPARKAGGIRGLLSSGSGATPGPSRRGSQESVDKGNVERARRALEERGVSGGMSGGGGGGGGTVVNGSGGGGEAVIYPFRDHGRLSLRTRGMRENVT